MTSISPYQIQNLKELMDLDPDGIDFHANAIDFRLMSLKDVELMIDEAFTKLNKDGLKPGKFLTKAKNFLAYFEKRPIPGTPLKTWNEWCGFITIHDKSLYSAFREPHRTNAYVKLLKKEGLLP